MIDMSIVVDKLDVCLARDYATEDHIAAKRVKKEGDNSASSRQLQQSMAVGVKAKEAAERCLENEAKLVAATTPVRDTTSTNELLSSVRSSTRSFENSPSPCTEKALVKMKQKTGNCKNGNALLKLTEEYLKKISRPKRKVLEEDIYVKEVESIIERDFFPYMKQLRAQTDISDAVDDNDMRKLQSLISKYGRSCFSASINTLAGQSSPSTFDTPQVLLGTGGVKSSTYQEGSGAGGGAVPVHNRNPSPPSGQTSVLNDHRYLLGDGRDGTVMGAVGKNENDDCSKKSGCSNDHLKSSLNTFMSRVTSEDNISFEEICTLQNISQRIKHHWIFEAEAEARSNLQIQNDRNSTGAIQPLAIQQSDTISKTKFSIPLDTWPYQAKNMLMYNPDGVDMALQDKVEDAKGNMMQIVHENTRFAPGFLADQDKAAKLSDYVAQTKAMKKGNIGPDGKEINENEDSNTVDGFSLIGTPSPMPGQGADASPAMFWGSIASTPSCLSESASIHAPRTRTNTPIFKIPDIPPRDKLGLQLAEKAAKNHRSKKTRALNEVQSEMAAAKKRNVCSNFGSTRSGSSIASMSPAAQLLLANRIRSGHHSGLVTSRASPASSVDNALRQSYRSPLTNSSPMSSPSSSSRSSKSSLNLVNSPMSLKDTIKTSSTARRNCSTTIGSVNNKNVPSPINGASNAASNLTDNLLELTNSSSLSSNTTTCTRKRLTASDFF